MYLFWGEKKTVTNRVHQVAFFVCNLVVKLYTELEDLSACNYENI